MGFTRFNVVDHTFNYSAPLSVWTHLTFVATPSNTTLYVLDAHLKPQVWPAAVDLRGLASFDFQGYLSAPNPRTPLEVYEAQLLAAYKNQQREIAHLQKFVDRFGAKASMASRAKSKEAV